MADKSPLTLACSEAMRQVSARRRDLLTGGIDAKRPKAWREYGYQDNLSFEDFYSAYSRHAVAHGAVHLITEKCWQSEPSVIEGDVYDNKTPETVWEATLRKLAKRTKLWHAMQQADTRRLVGHYSGILLNISDVGDWPDPVTGAAPVLKDLLVAWEGQLRPLSYDIDPRSETYGDVTMWEYDEGKVDPNDTVLGVDRQLSVHPDRVLILGDIRQGSSFLQAGFNTLVDMEKILGGSGESFLKNAARQIHLGFDKDINLAEIAKQYGVAVPDLQEIFDQTTRDLNRGIDSTLVTQGAEAKTLVAAVPQPKEHFDMAIQAFSASVRIASKILVGNQTGERASTEDLKAFNARCQSRRIGDLTRDITAAIDHLLRIRVLAPTSRERTVVWDDLNEATQGEKLELAFKMADINAKLIATGDSAFSGAEIREIAGYDSDPAVAPLGEDDA